MYIIDHTVAAKNVDLLTQVTLLLAALVIATLSVFSGKHSTYLQSRVMNNSRAIEGALVRTLVSIAVDGLTFIVGRRPPPFLQP
jgi:hypothetical protein